MDNRTIKNALGGTGFIGSLLALVIPKILVAFDAMSTAQSVHDVMELVKKDDWHISWNGIWILILIFSMLYLIGVNFDLFQAWRKAKQQANDRKWNITAIDAINWIANSTHESKSLDYDKRYILSVAAFREKALAGKIVVAGIKEGIYTHQRIPIKEWRRLRLAYGCVSGSRNRGNEGQLNSVSLTTEEAGKQKIIWSSLMVDRSQLKRAWSEIPHPIY